MTSLFQTITDGIVVTPSGLVHATCEYAAVCGHYYQWEIGDARVKTFPLITIDELDNDDDLWEALRESVPQLVAICHFCREMDLI